LWQNSNANIWQINFAGFIPGSVNCINFKRLKEDEWLIEQTEIHLSFAEKSRLITMTLAVGKSHDVFILSQYWIHCGLVG